MDPYHGLHRRFLNKRQGLGGALGSLLGGSTPSQSTTTPAASQSAGNSIGIGGIVTSLLGDVPTIALPSTLGPSSATTSSTPLTHPSSSSTGSTTTSPTSSSSRTTISSASTISTTPTPTSSAFDTVITSSDGTTIVYITNTSPVPSTTAAPTTSFLHNPSLEGGVFTLVGIVVLILAFIIVTCVLRKRSRDRLERDLAVAVTFDPGATDQYERETSVEKRRLSGSSSGHGHGYGYGYGVQPAYAPQQEYLGHMGYGQYPVAAYRAPSPNPAPYRAPSPAMSQPASQGGANLTRKFSDRKPVPPLLPNPTYDPANTHVSIPPQFYQQ